MLKVSWSAVTTSLSRAGTGRFVWLLFSDRPRGGPTSHPIINPSKEHDLKNPAWLFAPPAALVRSAALAFLAVGATAALPASEAQAAACKGPRPTMFASAGSST